MVGPKVESRFRLSLWNSLLGIWNWDSVLNNLVLGTVRNLMFNFLILCYVSSRKSWSVAKEESIKTDVQMKSKSERERKGVLLDFLCCPTAGLPSWDLGILLQDSLGLSCILIGHHTLCFCPSPTCFLKLAQSISNSCNQPNPWGQWVFLFCTLMPPWCLEQCLVNWGINAQQISVKEIKSETNLINIPGG